MGLQSEIANLVCTSNWHIINSERWLWQRDGDLSDWAVPVKGGTDPMADPFEEASLKKKQRVVQNKLNQVRNLVRAPSSSPSSLRVFGRHRLSMLLFF